MGPPLFIDISPVTETNQRLRFCSYVSELSYVTGTHFLKYSRTLVTAKDTLPCDGEHAPGATGGAARRVALAERGGEAFPVVAGPWPRGDAPTR